jgi:DNA-binding NarL/FixJ family response regulator
MKKYTILHLEDNQLFIDEIRFLLGNDQEIDYIGVKNVKDAWKKLTPPLPDLLIVDLMLENDFDPQPGINFIKDVREKVLEKLKIMVLTANTDKHPMSELDKLVDWYETKSFRPSMLKKKIMDILRSKGGDPK